MRVIPYILTLIEVKKMNNFQVFCLVLYILNFCPHGESALVNLQLDLRAECDKTSAMPTIDDLAEVAWFKKCVVERYGLQPSVPNDPNFRKPEFKEYLIDSTTSTPTSFEQTGMRIEKFFQRNNDWIKTKEDPKYNKLGDSSNLLVLTDARYLYVTYLLFKLSDKKLKVCSITKDGKIKIPTYACFKFPSGSTTATSDYDVSLIGPTSGPLIIKFNDYFKKNFKHPSEEVFDANVYAYSLECALPGLFDGLTSFYTKALPKLDFSAEFQMLELAGAYMKMFRYKFRYYKRLKVFAEKELGGLALVKDVKNRNHYFTYYIGKFEELDRTDPLTGGSGLRNEHNKVYGEIINNLPKVYNGQYNNFITKYVLEMSKALIYAAEAYHTRGSIRHVVGVMQKLDATISLTVMDYWVSMIENWGDANKVLESCKSQAEICLLKTVKYLYRTFNAMKNIHFILIHPMNKAAFALKDAMKFLPKNPMFGGKNLDPEVLAQQLVAKYKGKANEIPYVEMMQLLEKFGCSKIEQPQGKVLSPTCVDKIEMLVEAYDHVLVTSTSKPTTENVILLTDSGTPKPEPMFSLNQVIMKKTYKR